MRKLMVAAALAAGLFATGLEGAGYYTPGDSVTLTGTGIHADGGGAYRHGTNGVEIKVFTNGSGDLTLNLGTRRGARTFIAETTGANLAQPLTAPLPSGPTPCYFLIVGDIWSIPFGPAAEAAGTNRVRRSAVLNFSGGLIQFGPGKDNGLEEHSEQVWVKRHGRGSWTVSTDGIAVGLTSPDDDHNLAAYATSQKGGGVVPRAQYRLPFTLEAVCSRC